MKLISQKAADLIKYWIDRDRTLADNDGRLIANVMYGQLKSMGKDMHIMSAVELLKVMSEGKLYPPETIRRTRQTVQKNYPEYRGAKYEERQRYGKKVRKEIKGVGV